ncbi:DapH/DapD/GlmU-related protein [Lactiplantibacillus pentosus]|uniref:DapH/DapD/GlmU-related protein n=1 Tax=Lactiplantibacillus pentosus TaxID=1589 RepID=UPI00132FDBB1|nr:DapH/DapD/GlmU-related protein [Lactiplantibacillus pentosus]MBQ0837691.1 hypothetical protein [Lactiplantibacillus pentosus]MBU7464537.1 hypothetical protein [Lactiplantibacillus pentosus]MBU7490197.1 hypothetical protein [Lactiplantibacillus pentosus]MBU7495130.1 hypothetical protein [Lactiplantibacillus pentosus]MBU7521074.1 hypothetical protein [Lactiplantibacillus pentosus]
MKTYDMNSAEYQAGQSDFEASRLGSYHVNQAVPGSAEQQQAFDQLFGDRLPADSTIWGPLQVDRVNHLSIGHHVFINHDLTTVALGGIFIEDNVQIAPNVSLITANHDINQMNILNTAPIRIQANAWVGTNVTILPGITIGTGAIVGAGAVVTKDVPAHTVAVGNPAKVIKKLTRN